MVAPSPSRPASRPISRRRLSPDDWAEAALHAIAEGGLAAVSVEGLAAQLGATKGSFYWHFRDRDALIAAALELWERRETREVIEQLERIEEPLQRLHHLATVEIGGGRLDARIDAALHADATNPVVAPIVRRVAAERMAFLERMYRQLGFDEDDARYRALLTFTAYVGRVVLGRSAPALGPASEDERTSYLRFLTRILA